ncbi:MAG: pyridoxal 5'-phosphate synthase [Gammaproteobacteria bacterium]|jgi:pyridoxamine 5'-phosphate oxidase
MFEIKSKIQEPPYQKFYHFYDEALKKNQTNSEAMAISSYNPSTCEVSSRFVNLKYIIDEEWIFFSNYKSPKALQFASHDQISVLFYWDVLNLQVRIQSKIKKVKPKISDDHFAIRSPEKNLLAIISDQSSEIQSYDDLVKKYSDHKLSLHNLDKRPDYWGGFSFKPYSFEFWTGQKFRLNLRESYFLDGEKWKKKILQP